MGRGQSSIDDNDFNFKEELSNVHNEYDSLSKSVRHLSLRTHSLNDSRNQDGVPEIKDTKNFHSRRTIGSSKKWVCHFYGKLGHIRPFYYKLHGYNKPGLKIGTMITKRKVFLINILLERMSGE